MTNYSNYLPVKLAKKLLEYGFPLYKYPIGGYDGEPYFDTLDESDPNWSECDRYKIPTYAEVIDGFSTKGIIIWLEPFKTFALKGKIGYVWRISFVDEELMN